MRERVSFLDKVALGRHTTHSPVQTALSDTAARDDTRGIERTHLIIVVLAAFGIAFFAQALFVKLFGVNIPFWDEWSTDPTILAEYRIAGLNWHYLFLQHGEHRILTTRLALLGSFVLLGEWSPIANMLISAFLVGCITAIWSYTLRCLHVPAWVTWISALLLVSPIQYTNILWGFQIQFYTFPLSVILGISSVVLARRISWPMILAAIVACFFSTFSVAAGMVAWPVMGACLLLKALLQASTPGAALRDKALWFKALVFCAAAIALVLFYFHDYTLPATPEYHAQSVSMLAHWVLMALAYPFTDTASTRIVILAGAFLLQWTPIIAIALICLRRRHNGLAQQKLVLVCGIALFVGLVAGVIGYGRAGYSPVLASRYITVFHWSSLLCLFAIAELLHESRSLPNMTKRRAGVFALSLICGAALLAHEYHALKGLDSLRHDQQQIEQMRRTLIAYLNDPSPDRQIGDPAPFPWKDQLKERLDNPAMVATLPTELLPPPDPGGWTISGDAWVRNGVYSTTPPIERGLAWGSWNGSDSHTGRIVSGPIHCDTALFSIPVAGYPSPQRGNMLAIESVDDPQRRIVYTQGDVGERWAEWNVDVSAFRGRDVRIVAVDGGTGMGGWLGFGMPTRIQRPVLLIRQFLDYLEYIAGTVGAALWVIYLALSSRLPKKETCVPDGVPVEPAFDRY